MTINLKIPDGMSDLQPRITVFGVGGAGGNAVNNMIQSGLEGVEFVVANTDAQALAMSSAERRIQMGTAITEGLGAGSQPQIGAAAAEETMAEILDYVSGAHMVFITAGMGGGTGTGAAPVIARLAREQDILTIGVVTKPFQFEGARRMAIAELGIAELEKHVDTLIVIPNQNLFRVANERTTFADAFAMADQVLYSGVAGITDLMVKEGLINLDFADVRTIMQNMGKAMMGTGEACGENRAIEAAEAAIANPLLDDVSMKGARGLLISITGGEDLTLYEVDEAATRIRSEVDADSNIILGATFDHALEGYIRVSVVATGIDGVAAIAADPAVDQMAIGEKSEDESPFAKFNISSSHSASQQLEAAAVAVVSEAQSIAGGEEFDDDVGYATDGDDDDGSGKQPEGPRPSAYNSNPAQLDNEVTVRRVDASVGLARRSSAPALQDNPPNEIVSTHDHSRPFIPPQAAELPHTGPRMPRVDEFPVIAQRAISARDMEPEDHGIEAQKRKTGFLERLASVGLGRRDAGMRPIAADEPRFGEAMMPTQDEGHELDHLQGDAEALSVRPTQQNGQQKGTPVPESQKGVLVEVDGDDHLEIPAFLRRQAN